MYCSKLVTFLAVLVAMLGCARAEPTEDKQALLDFLEYTHHSSKVNWKRWTSPCTGWVGVTCSHDRSRVIAVRLPGMGFRGEVPLNTLSRLSGLQILSLRLNGFNGSFPSDFSQLRNLTALYLQSNNFSGSLPADFSAWINLSILNLSNNEFNGTIPPLVSNLTHLTAFSVANNSLSGDLPDLILPSLQLLDLSNNNLTGDVPPSLQRFPNSAFSGNHLSPNNNISLAPSSLSVRPKKKLKKPSEPVLLGIVIGGCALGFIAVALVLILCHSKKEDKNTASEKSLKKDNVPAKRAGGNTNLVFFEGCTLGFDLEDLLRASAEVLGRGTFGTTYKAALEDATTVVVKRLKEVCVGRKEFELQMGAVGRIAHENVSPLRAYYYSKDEKLMVYDYYSQGSVSAMLHARRGENQLPLDWETRVRIAVGAARGIAHIHGQSGGKLVHGNIKSSNIFLNSKQQGCVSDLGLATLIAPVVAPTLASRTAGYRAPEVADTRKATQASDVYSFGVLLLELLTGKSPVHAPGGGDEIVHLVRWVHSVVREEWTAEVFDVELLRYPNIEEEMVEMLQIGLVCAGRMPEQRPKMAEVVKMVEGIRMLSTGNQTSTGGSTPYLTPPMPQIGSSYTH